MIQILQEGNRNGMFRPFFRVKLKSLESADVSADVIVSKANPVNPKDVSIHLCGVFIK